MQKIYSRARIKIPKITYNGDNNGATKKKILKILGIVMVGILVAKNIIDILNPIINAQCVSEAKNVATVIYNEQTSLIMKKYKYDDLATIEKDDNGRVQMVKLNVIPVNEITSEVVKNIQNKFNDVDSVKISIRLGSFLGIKLFSGVGPKITVRVSSAGNIETNLKSEFATAGINQTLHQIYLEIKCKIWVFTPYDNVTEEVTSKILIAEAIIVGEIPSSYYNLNGNDGSNVVRKIE